MTARTIVMVTAFALFAVSHQWFSGIDLYDDISWLDDLMHVWGGACIALGMFVLHDIGLVPRAAVRLLVVMSVVLVVAVAWEVLGYYAWDAWDRPDYVEDTARDILAGIAGGFLGYVLGRVLPPKTVFRP